MSERRPTSPIAHALAAAIREISARIAAEGADRRAKMTVVDGGKRGGQAA